MKIRHLLLIISLSLFIFPSSSLAECKEVRPEIKMDKDGNQVEHGLEVKCFMESKEWKNGKKHGKRTRWNENGVKWFEENYKDGKKHGKWTYWWEDGEKRLEENYKNGKKHGKATLFR